MLAPQNTIVARPHVQVRTLGAVGPSVSAGLTLFMAEFFADSILVSPFIHTRVALWQAFPIFECIALNTPRAMAFEAIGALVRAPTLVEEVKFLIAVGTGK